ncbi:hypothetical protein Vadar_011151 [Vaccinium darrowii]|uniref:Uncharacterized protein n=1 Tax=Vaccinium darrowii TaxID=229202 RepID=A0ACB7Z370_9ERIC|nr:hypothetical protein Vadar_011151 [Vaccinium darrowii]
MRLLDHPNVVSLKHCFFSTTEKDELCLNLVLEYVHETVHRVIKHYNKLTQKDAADIRKAAHISGQGKEVKALNLFEEILKKGLSPSPASYYTALLAHRRMEIVGLQPGRSEYECLVWACTREEHCIVAKELYSWIRKRGIWKWGVALLNKMEEKGLNPGSSMECSSCGLFQGFGNFCRSSDTQKNGGTRRKTHHCFLW